MASRSSNENDPNREQNIRLAQEMGSSLNALDAEYAELEVPLPERPLKALQFLLSTGAVEVRFGTDPVDQSEPHKNIDQLWFQVLYSAVEYWYGENYGFAAVATKGTDPLEGVLLVRGVPYALRLPAQRSKVETEGETAWMYFEEQLGDGEDAIDFLIDPPNFKKFVKQDLKKIVATAEEVSNLLRFVEFRRLTNRLKEPRAAELIPLTLTYLNQAARRMVSGRQNEWGPTWFDLQMANETALKAVILENAGKQPREHDLSKLLNSASEYGVVLNQKVLVSWPSFKAVSDWRYGQGRPPGLGEQFKHYLISLQLVRAAMMNVPVGLNSGAGILLRYAPWKLRTQEKD